MVKPRIDLLRVVPVNDTVGPGVDRGVVQVGVQGTRHIPREAAGAAVGHAMSLLGLHQRHRSLESNRGSDYCGMGVDSLHRAAHIDELRDEIRPIEADAPPDDPTEAVPDYARRLATIPNSSLDGPQQSSCQMARTLRVESDAGHVWVVADALQPEVKFVEIGVGPHETGDEDDRTAVAPRDAQSVIDG
jgi:hypothetical protein